jgi:hypothetical protein
MIERVLRGHNVPGEFGDHSREGVARAVEVEVFYARLPRVPLQIFNEAM